MKPKKDKNIKSREFSIEESYHIFIFFLMDFWWNFFKELLLKKKLITEQMTSKELEFASPEKKSKHVAYESYDFVFDTLPGLPCGCSNHFEKLIEKNLKVYNKEWLHRGDLMIKEENLFQIVINFFHYVGKEFKGFPEEPLNFVIEWFEDMIKHPETHEEEWKIWNKAILNITKHGYRSSVPFGTHVEEEDLYLYYPGGPSRLNIEDFN